MSDATMPPLRWEAVPLDVARETWDRELMAFDDYTLDQSFAWGEFKRRCGWLVHRLVARDAAGRIRALAQGLVRRYALGFGLAWFPGGPVGEIAAWEDDFRRSIAAAVGVGALYCRIFPHRPTTVADQATLSAYGWTPSGSKLRSGLSMTLRLDRPLEEIRRGLSGNWRHNLKRAQSRAGGVRRWARRRQRGAPGSPGEWELGLALGLALGRQPGGVAAAARGMSHFRDSDSGRRSRK